MKNLFKITMLLVASSLMFSSCNCFKKMAKNPDAVKVTVTPEVLTLNNGKIVAEVKAEIPAKYFDKKAELKVTPVIVYEGGLEAAETVILQGEKVKDNGIVVTKGETSSLTRTVTFNYKAGMELCEMKLLVEVKCPKGKCKEFTLVNANDGSLPTAEQAAVLAKGGKEAEELKKAFGVTVAKGLNTLQKDIDFAEAMKEQANNYKNVTTVVTKADLVYKINSSVVAKAAVKTSDFDALKAKVEENKANDRASQTVYVNGYASPDGPEKFNDKLSEKRSQSGLKAVKKLLKEYGLNIDAAAYGEDWAGFQEAVAASNIADKDLILQVLKMYSSSAEREKEIKNMATVFKALKTDVLPQLRRAQVVNSADITGKTDAEMTALVKAGKAAEMDVEELLHIAQVNPEVAAAALEAAAAKYGDARAYNNLAIVYAQAGNYDAALAALDKAAKAGDKSAELNNNYALVYLAKGETAKAEQYAAGAAADTKALLAAAKGDYSAATKGLSGYNAAIAQVQEGNYAAAKKSLASDNSAKADYLRAVIAAKEGNKAEAKSALNSAIAKDPSLAAKAKKDAALVAVL